MIVRYAPEKRDELNNFRGFGFASWPVVAPMERAKFPEYHPACPGTWACTRPKAKCPCGPDQIECSDELRAFRKRGYYAEAVKTGDGLQIRTLSGQDASTVAIDLAACFPGWDVVVEKDERVEA